MEREIKNSNLKKTMEDPVIIRDAEDVAMRAERERRQRKVSLSVEVQEDYSIEKIDERLEKLVQDLKDFAIAKRKTKKEIERMEKIKLQVLEKIK